MAFSLKRKAVTVSVLVAVATITGPFGTYLELTLLPRFAYWLLAVIGCGFFMNVGIYFALTHPDISRVSALGRLAVAVLLAAIPGSLVVMMLEFLFRDMVLTPGFSAKIWACIAVIGFVVAQFEYRHLVMHPPPAVAALVEEPPADAAPEEAPDVPVFLRQLKPGIGRNLVSMTIHDHYLEVVTDGGRDMILKRMGDAVAELSGYPGLQVHRSHWLALDAVEDIERDNGKHFALMRDGRKIPVSRAKAPELRKRLAERAG